MLLELGLAMVAGRAGAPNVTLLDLTGLKPGAEASADSRRRSWDVLQAASALEGLVNRRDPRLYLLFVGDRARLDRYWLARLQKTWLKDRPTVDVDALDQALTRFRRTVRGVVVWDERVPATSNVADTVAGVENLLPVRYDPSPGSLYRHLTDDPAGPRLPVQVRLIREDGGPLFTGEGLIPGTAMSSSGSAKCDAYLWAAENYLKPGKCAPGWMGYYPDASWLQTPRDVPLERTLLTNHDFFVSKRGFFFDLSPWVDEAPEDDPHQPLGTDANTLRFLLAKEYALGRGGMTHVGGFTPWDQKYTDHTAGGHGGVPTEWRYAEILSCYNAYMDADAPGLHAMANASFFTHEPLKPRYPQPNRPTRQSLIERGYLRPDGTVVSKAYVTFYVGDYDSAAWLYTTMPDNWDDPARGSVPLGWAFNPALEARFPTGLVYARETATPNDFFVAGDSGAGYLNPGDLEPPRLWSGLPSGLAAWEAFNRRLFRRWDLGIVGFVIDGYAPAMNPATREAYARFAPDGVVAQKTPELSAVNGVPFLRMRDDLPRGSAEQAAGIVDARAPKGAPSFSIFRTVLWSPHEHQALVRRLRARRPDVEVVDPYTLMALAKIQLAGTSGGAPPKREAITSR